MRVVTRWALLLLVAACEPQLEVAAEPQGVRLASHMGLVPMEPTVNGFMTRHMMDLVYDVPLSQHFMSIRVDGVNVHLRMRPSINIGVRELAAAFEHPDCVSTSVDGDEIVARFRSVDAARSVTLEDYFLALGPYRVVETTTTRLLLARRDFTAAGPPEIDVVLVKTEEEEWRRFLAGELDILPFAMSETIAYVQQIPSVKVVSVEFPRKAALWFRSSQGPTSDPRLRRAIAGAIRREPLATIVNGDALTVQRFIGENFDAATRELQELGISPATPLTLRVVVPAPMPDLMRASRILQQQLASAGINLDVEEVSNEELRLRQANKDFDLLLFHGDLSRESWHSLSGGSPSNFVGYSSAEFDRAMATGNEVQGRVILERDVPLTPLFQLKQGVVVRRGLCGVQPKYSHDLSWLADIRPCRAGEDN